MSVVAKPATFWKKVMAPQACNRVLRRRKNGKIRDNQEHEDCPRCGQVKDTIHVVQCKGTGTDEIFELAVQKLEVTLCDKFTAPRIKTALTTRIRQWRQHSNNHTTDQETIFPFFRHYDEFGTKAAVAEQDKIGWYNLLLGLMSTKWTDAQQKYLESIGKRNTGKRWTIAIINKLWDIAWDMWSHRNHITHNTIHPRKRQELDILKQQIQELYLQGPQELLSQDRPLFDKSVEKLLKGNAKEQEQWVISVKLAQHRAEAYKEEQYPSMQPERSLMENWIGISHQIEEAQEEEEKNDNEDQVGGYQQPR
jgi:hypothetical protein